LAVIYSLVQVEKMASAYPLRFQERHKNDDPLFATRRKEDQVDVRAAVAFSIGKGWTITPQASYTNSVSTVDFYSNQRVQYWVSARMEF
jgi:hypothetical protein